MQEAPTLRSLVAEATPMPMRMAVRRWQYRASLAERAHERCARIRARYLVFSRMRAGSSWLVSLLNSLPGVYNAGEILNPHHHRGMRRSWKPRWEIRRHIRNSLDAGPRPVAGAKLLKIHLDLHRVSVDELSRWVPGLRAIVIYRQRQFAQYVSVRTAQETGVWHRDKGQAETAASIRIDRARYERFSAATRAFYDNLVEDLERLDVPYETVSYEALRKDPEGIVAESICPLLEAAPGHVSSPRTSMTGRPLADRVLNFDEVSELTYQTWEPDWDRRAS